jgi:hypothetical protein
MRPTGPRAVIANYPYSFLKTGHSGSDWRVLSTHGRVRVEIPLSPETSIHAR